MKKFLIYTFAIIGVISMLACIVFVGYTFGMNSLSASTEEQGTTPTPTLAMDFSSINETILTPTIVPTGTNAPVLTSTPTPVVSLTPTNIPTNTPTPTSTPMPTETPKQEELTFTYFENPYDRTKFALTDISVWSEATDFGKKVGTIIAKDTTVVVLGKCNETGYYHVLYAGPTDTDFSEGYIHPDHFQYLTTAEEEFEKKVQAGLINPDGSPVGRTPIPTATPSPKPTSTPTPKPTSTPTPTKVPSITASKTELLFTSVEPQTIDLYIEIEGNCSIDAEYMGDRIVTYDWVDSEGYRGVQVKITPGYNGTTTMKYYIVDTDLSVDIKITVDIESLPEIPELGEEQIVVSQTEMIFTDTEPQILYVKVKDGKSFVINTRPSNASYETGTWLGDVIPIIITPTNNGSSTFEINLEGDESVWIKVKIRVEIHTDREMFTSLETVDLADAYAGAIVKFGTYEQDNNLSNGAEEIEWLVLDVQDGKALLLSKYVLAHTTAGTEIWGESSMRRWLQGIFYEQAFSMDEQDRICTMDLGTQDRRGKLLEDTVFTLSKEEVEQYFDDDFLADEFGDSLLKRATTPTEYAVENGIYTNIFKDSEYYGLSLWWTRTSLKDGELYHYAYYFVDDDGEFRSRCGSGSLFNSFTAQHYSYLPIGARPAIWVEIE